MGDLAKRCDEALAVAADVLEGRGGHTPHAFQVARHVEAMRPFVAAALDFCADAETFNAWARLEVLRETYRALVKELGE